MHFALKIWLVFKRTCLQKLGFGEIISDQLSHFIMYTFKLVYHIFSGFIMSASISKIVYVGSLPDEICVAVPIALYKICSEAVDQLPYVLKEF